MTVPKFRAYGRKYYRMSTEIEPKEMYYDVSVVTTFYKKELHVIVNFGMWNEEEYNGTELIDYDLMQSTGLKDKNGTEVFEGDVVEDEDGRRYVVKKKREFSAFFLYPCDNPEEFMAFYPGIILRVIGNVYANPDLLEGLNDQ